MLRRLLIIPARGGSKRIKYKNIKIFKNKPIIQYAIVAAKKSKLFNLIHVSTDSKKIKDVVEQISRGITYYRPKNLSNDKTPLIEVFKYIVNNYKKRNKFFEEIWFLNPCSPLIDNKDLIKASIFFKNQKNNSVLSIAKYSPPIEWAFKLKDKSMLPINKNNQKKTSQSFSDKYYDTGNFGIFSSSVFYKKEKISFSGYKLQRNKAVDIDTLEDWELAISLAK